MLSYLNSVTARGDTETSGFVFFPRSTTRPLLLSESAAASAPCRLQRTAPCASRFAGISGSGCCQLLSGQSEALCLSPMASAQQTVNIIGILTPPHPRFAAAKCVKLLIRNMTVPSRRMERERGGGKKLSLVGNYLNNRMRHVRGGQVI